MRIGGLLKFSLIDYPGKVAAVIFTQGCNFRCPFCYNPALVLPELFQAPIDLESVLFFLKKRVGQIEGVVVTGGEPTIQPGLTDFLYSVKAMGFLVKLDTNGSCPEIVRDIFDQGLADYVAMDIKSSLSNYDKAAGIKVDEKAIRSTIDLVRKSGVDYEFRTTAFAGIVSLKDVCDISILLGSSQKHSIRRGSLKRPVLNHNFFFGIPDYSDKDWENIYKFHIDRNCDKKAGGNPA